MTTDISGSLSRAAERRAHWGPQAVRAALAATVEQRGSSCTAQWDDEAGEDWGRVVDESGVVILVSALMPLVVVRSAPAMSAITFSRPVPEIVEVGSIDASLLRADLVALLTAFPDMRRLLADNQTGFSTERFTADHLWFLTV